MKKGILPFVAGVIVCGAAMVLPMNGEAAGISAGAGTWYTQWRLEGPDGQSYKSTPAMLYGPILGVDFAQKWSITSVLLTGNLRFDDLMGPGATNYRRYDSDSTLNYSISRWLKVFGGVKYMRYDNHESGKEVPVFGSAEVKHYAYGPGFGIGLTMPLLESLYALVNVSGLYLSAYESRKSAEDVRYIEKGYNAAASLAYYIEGIATTLSAGVRYQYFKSDDRNSDDGNWYSGFYGITFSAVHHFSLDSAE